MGREVSGGSGGLGGDAGPGPAPSRLSNVMKSDTFLRLITLADVEVDGDSANSSGDASSGNGSGGAGGPSSGGAASPVRSRSAGGPPGAVIAGAVVGGGWSAPRNVGCTEMTCGLSLGTDRYFATMQLTCVMLQLHCLFPCVSLAFLCCALHDARLAPRPAHCLSRSSRWRRHAAVCLDSTPLVRSLAAGVAGVLLLLLLAIVVVGAARRRASAQSPGKRCGGARRDVAGARYAGRWHVGGVAAGQAVCRPRMSSAPLMSVALGSVQHSLLTPARAPMHTSRLPAVGGPACGPEEAHPKASAFDDSSCSSPGGSMAGAATATASPCSSHCIPVGPVPVHTVSNGLPGLQQLPREHGRDMHASDRGVHGAEDAGGPEAVTAAVAVDAGAAAARLAALRLAAALDGTDASALAQSSQVPGEPLGDCGNWEGMVSSPPRKLWSM